MYSWSSNTIILELSVLEVDNWLKDHISSFYGKNKICSLCEGFQLTFSKAITSSQDYLNNGGKQLPNDLKPLFNCAKVIACKVLQSVKEISAT